MMKMKDVTRLIYLIPIRFFFLSRDTCLEHKLIYEMADGAGPIEVDMCCFVRKNNDKKNNFGG